MTKAYCDAASISQKSLSSCWPRSKACAELGRSIGELPGDLGLELGGVDEDLSGERRIRVAHR